MSHERSKESPVPSARSRPTGRECSRMFENVRECSIVESILWVVNGERVPGAARTVETVRLLGPIRRDRWTVASYTDARTTRERTVSRESFIF